MLLFSVVNELAIKSFINLESTLLFDDKKTLVIDLGMF